MSFLKLRRVGFAIGLGVMACAAQAQINFFENHDSGSSTFTQTAITGGNPWAMETNAANAHTSDTYWRLREPSSISDSVLTSPTLNYTATTTGPVTLSFWHKFGFEFSDDSVGFDGGIVELQINGGAWSNIGAGAFTTNGYTHTISSSFSSPIGGQSAFSGNSPGFTTSDSTTNWINSIAMLNGFVAGDSFAIRFRGASDSSVSKNGWLIDEISLTADAAPVPEPMSMLALGIGALGVFAKKRRR